MYAKFCKAIKNLHRGQKGITGLETAIILIAFVTVASVLAYSVLSAGIFSSERGKAAVYSGLSSAQSTMSLKGTVVGTAADTAGKAPGAVGYAGADHLASITFNLALAIAGDSIDLSKVVMNYWDNALGVTALNLDTGTPTAGDWDFSLTSGSGSILSGTVEAVVTVYLPATAAISSYETFTVQINPPTGASITLQRTLGPIANIMSLN
jgi:archaeal flagellin FlaB